MAIITDQPFHESFLERIVNVNWAGSGAVFVSGDFCCFERYVKIPKFDAEQNWQGLGSLSFGPGGGTFASSYGNTEKEGPMFLIGGHGSGGTVGPILMRSRDGLKWERIGAASQMAHNDILALVWNERDKLFYLKSDHSDNRAYYSADGLYWFFAYSTFETYCIGIIPGVADGVYGYDKSQDLVIIPAYNLPNSEFTSGNVVAITNASKKPKQHVIDVGLRSCNCVAYKGGIWMAGGNEVTIPDKDGNLPPSSWSGTTSSIDGANTWFVSTVGDSHQEEEPTGGYSVETIVGAPVQDFK